MFEGKKIFAVIMAAGKGARIGATDKPKVMFEVAGKPIIGWALAPFDSLKNNGVVDRIVTVVGFHGNQVIDYLADKSEFVWQKDQLGTGHAVLQAQHLIGDEEGLTIIVNGDHALYTTETISKLLKKVIADHLTLGFGVVKSKDKFDDYGRVIRDHEGKITGIIERAEADEKQRKIPERNINLYVVDNKWLFGALKKIKTSAVKKEYYVTDILMIAVDEGKKVEAVEIEHEQEAMGINTEEDRKATEAILSGDGKGDK